MEELDALILAVVQAIPDADFVTVGRQAIRVGAELERCWVIEFSLPRRNKAFKVMKGQTTSIKASGSTVSEALSLAVRDAHYHRTGTLPETA